MKNLLRFQKGIYVGILIACISLTGAGCGVWRNFTTYFNLYYNLSDLYTQAEKAVKDQKRNIFDLEEIPISSNATALFNQVIEKSSKLLQFNAESSFVDDALLMLGKSFYYMQNYQKALRKFDELVVGQPNSSLVLEAEYWGAKTQLRLRNYDDGLKRLKAVKEKAIAVNDGNVLTLVYIEEIKIELGKKNYVAAVDICKSLIKYDYDSEISAETSFELGQLYLQLNQYKDAAQAFRDVNNYSPGYELIFNSAVENGRALREINENEAALKVFQRLRSEAKYSDKFDVLDLEVGLCNMNLENYKLAMTKLKYVDTAFANTQSAGIARYYLGKILEENYQLYDSASGFYKKVLGSSAPPEILAKAQSKVNVFTKYTTLVEQLRMQNKQLSYLKDSTLYVKDSIQFAEDTAKAAKEAREKILASADNKRNNRGGADDRRGNETQNLPVNNSPIPGAPSAQAPVYPKIPIDTLNANIAKTKYDLGSLYFADLDRVDSALVYYNDILENYKNDKIAPNTLFALGNCYETMNNKQKADSIFNYIYDNYKTEPVVNSAAVKIDKPQVELNFDPGKSLFLEAEELMKKKEYMASVRGFYHIFEKHPHSAYAPKALLASGWIYENRLKSNDSAAVMYDSVISRYPQTKYALSVKAKMDFYKTEMQKMKHASRDSLHLASDSLKTKHPDLAIDSLKAPSQEAASVSDSVGKTLIADKGKTPKAREDEDLAPKKKEAVKEEQKQQKAAKRVTLGELNDLQRVNDKIAEAEKKMKELETEKNKLLDAVPGTDPQLKDAVKMLLETKANLEKLTKK
jgi:TolA-binding protein